MANYCMLPYKGVPDRDGQKPVGFFSSKITPLMGKLGSESQKSKKITNILDFFSTFYNKPFSDRILKIVSLIYNSKLLYGSTSMLYF